MITPTVTKVEEKTKVELKASFDTDEVDQMLKDFEKINLKGRKSDKELLNEGETITFEQTPFVYQVETLFHVGWLADGGGLQSPYTRQTLKEDLVQEAMRIWQKEKFDTNNVAKNLTLENDRKNAVIVILERLLRFKRTSNFEDGIDKLYRDKHIMNEIYKEQLDKVEQLKKQIQNLYEVSNIINPNSPYNFTEFKTEIKRLKIQDLTHQLIDRRAELEQLTNSAKSKLRKVEKFVLEKLLKKHSKIFKDNDNSKTEKLNELKEVLNETLTNEEIKILLDKQEEVFTLEKRLNSLN